MTTIKTHLLDTSALIKLFVRENGSLVLSNYRKQAKLFWIPSLCLAEALGVFKAKYLRGDLSEEAYLTACESLSAEVRNSSLSVIDIDITSREIFNEVESSSKRNSLDIVDAYQLVILKHAFLANLPGESKMILVTADSALEAAAQREGLRVWNCLKTNAPVP